MCGILNVEEDVKSTRTLWKYKEKLLNKESDKKDMAVFPLSLNLLGPTQQSHYFLQQTHQRGQRGTASSCGFRIILGFNLFYVAFFKNAAGLKIGAESLK